MVKTADLDQLKLLWQKHPAHQRYREKGSSAVLAPIVLIGGEAHLLFEKRAENLTHQPGEICFPGGRIEPGESARAAAVRETCEELVVDPEQIEIITPLDVQSGPSGAPLWPFAALIHDYRKTYSTAEVDHVFSVPIAWFMDHPPKTVTIDFVRELPEGFPFELIPGGRDYHWRGRPFEMYFYEHPHAVIWGITARIVERLTTVFRHDLIIDNNEKHLKKKIEQCGGE